MDDVYYGVLFSLGGNIAITLGHHIKVVNSHNDSDQLSLTKLDHSRTREINRSLSNQCRNYIESKCNRQQFQFYFGQLFFLGGTIASAYSLAYAPQTLLACIGSIQFVTNLICSKIFHAKSITLLNIIGTFAVIIGCIFIVFGFSAHGQQTEPPTINDLFQNYNSEQYISYLVSVLIIASLTLICGCFCGSSTSDANHHLSAISAKKKLTHLTTSGTSMFELKKIEYYLNIISGILYAICSALPGTQSVVLGKTLAVIVRSYMAGKLVFFEPFDWFNMVFISVVFISWLSTQIYWIYRYNESMKKFDPVFIMPMNQVMWITFSTVAGGLYFHEFENATVWQWVALVGGLVINYTGLFHLVPSSDAPKKLSYADVSNMDLKRPVFKSKNRDINKNKHKRHGIRNLANRLKSLKNHISNNKNQNSISPRNQTINECNDNQHQNFQDVNQSDKATSPNIEIIELKTAKTVTSIDTGDKKSKGKSSAIPSFITNFMNNAYNSVKNAMLSPSVQSPLESDLNFEEDEPLLGMNVDKEMHNHHHNHNQSHNRKIEIINNSEPMESQSSFDNISTNSGSSVNHNRSNYTHNDIDSIIKEASLDVQTHITKPKQKQQKQQQFRTETQTQRQFSSMDTNLNMNDMNRMSFHNNRDPFDYDSDCSSSSSVCLHASPTLSSDSSNHLHVEFQQPGIDIECVTHDFQNDNNSNSDSDSDSNDNQNYHQIANNVLTKQRKPKFGFGNTI